MTVTLGLIINGSRRESRDYAAALDRRARERGFDVFATGEEGSLGLEPWLDQPVDIIGNLLAIGAAIIKKLDHSDVGRLIAGKRRIVIID